MRYFKQGEIVSLVLVLTAVAAVSGLVLGLRNGQIQTELNSRAQIPVSPQVTGPYPSGYMSPTPIVPQGKVDVQVTKTTIVPTGRAIVLKICTTSSCRGSVFVTDFIRGFGGGYYVGKDYYLTVEPNYVNSYNGDVLEKIDGLSMSATGCSSVQSGLRCPFEVTENATTNLSVTISFTPNASLSPIPTPTPYIPTYPSGYPYTPAPSQPPQPSQPTTTPYPTVALSTDPTYLTGYCNSPVNNLIVGNVSGANLIWRRALNATSYYLQVNDLNDQSVNKACPSPNLDGNGSFCTTVNDTTVKNGFSAQMIIQDQSFSFQPINGHSYNWSVQAIDEKGNRSNVVSGPMFTCQSLPQPLPIPGTPGPIKPSYPPPITSYPYPSTTPAYYPSPTFSPSISGAPLPLRSIISINGDYKKVDKYGISVLKKDQYGVWQTIDTQSRYSMNQQYEIFSTYDDPNADYTIKSYLTIRGSYGETIPLKPETGCPGTVDSYHYCTMHGTGDVKFTYSIPFDAAMPLPSIYPSTTPTPPMFVTLPTRPTIPPKRISTMPPRYITSPPKRVPTSLTPQPKTSVAPPITDASELDVNRSGIVDVADYLIAMRNYGQTVIAADTGMQTLINAQFISRILTKLGYATR